MLWLLISDQHQGGTINDCNGNEFSLVKLEVFILDWFNVLQRPCLPFSARTHKSALGALSMGIVPKTWFLNNLGNNLSVTWVQTEGEKILMTNAYALRQGTIRTPKGSELGSVWTFRTSCFCVYEQMFACVTELAWDLSPRWPIKKIVRVGPTASLLNVGGYE